MKGGSAGVFLPDAAGQTGWCDRLRILQDGYSVPGKKGVYSEVNAILDGSADNAVKVRYAQVAEQLPLMQEVYEKLAPRRLQRGAMNIESDEAKILVDESGRCTGVEKRVRGVSECMIEEFMLLANMCAARLAKEKDIPFVYRVHDQPEAERVEALKKALLAMKVDAGFAGETPHRERAGSFAGCYKRYTAGTGGCTPM